MNPPSMGGNGGPPPQGGGVGAPGAGMSGRRGLPKLRELLRRQRGDSESVSDLAPGKQENAICIVVLLFLLFHHIGLACET